MSAAKCSCGDKAVTQAVFRRNDGTHFLGQPTCRQCEYPFGPLRHAVGVEIVDRLEIR